MVLDIGDRKAAKIYRRTYSRNSCLVKENDEFVPKLFLSPFNKDVTSLYLNTCDLSINVLEDTKCKNYYLSVFGDFVWNAVALGKEKQGCVYFEDMGKDVVYLPICYENDRQCCFNYPFVLRNNQTIDFLIPDMTRRQSAILYRKYPMNLALYSYVNSMEGICIEVSNDSNFVVTDTILILEDAKYPFYSRRITDVDKFRYLRIRGQEGKLHNIAEIVFKGEENQTLMGKSASQYAKLFDGDPLTYVLINGRENVDVDFEKQIKLSQLVVLPRGDGNGVYPHKLYELKYFDIDGWHTLGKKWATDYQIEYDNIPVNALCWLHCLSGGVEERIFVIDKDGRVCFW